MGMALCNERWIVHIGAIHTLWGGLLELDFFDSFNSFVILILFPASCTSLFYHGETAKLFVGLSNGCISVWLDSI